MIYLYWYAVVGVVVLAVVFGAHRLAQRDESEALHDLLDAMNPDGKTLSNRIRNNIVVPALAAVAVVMFWPVAVYVKTKEVFSKKGKPTLDGGREFAVERGHLQECLSVQDIEARETVDDPLGAVPNLPFGHLNAAWRRFLDARSERDELWSFTTRWQTTWGGRELRCGYALVQDGKLGGHFLTMCKELPEGRKQVAARVLG